MARSNQSITIPNKCADDFCLPALGFGTYGMGGKVDHDRQNDDAADIEAIRSAVGHGFKHIDTAELYADGYTEALIKRALNGLDRQSLFITTKVRRSHLRYDDLIRAAQGSLERLGLKQVDLYLIHGPSGEVPIAESMRAMDYLLEHELTRYIGVSNFNVNQLAAAQAATKYRIVNNQIHYNLSARAYETNGTIAYCQQHNILVTAYRIIGYDQIFGEGLQILTRLAGEYNKTPRQIALNWLVGKPGVVGLIKARAAQHLVESLGALGWELSATDREQLDRDFPRGETINLSI